MLKKTAIAVGLAMVAGTGMAADNSMTSDADTSAPTKTGGSSDSSLAAEFHRLDTNNDGVLSRDEASKNNKVSKVYDSLDTGNTIEDNAKNSGKNGITLDQFKAGMQAAKHGGTVGKAASGGETYTVMKNGDKRATSDSADKAKDTMNRSRQDMQSAGDKARDKASQADDSARNKMSGMRDSAGNRMSSMKDRAHNQSDRMRNGASKHMQRSSNRMSNGVNRMQQRGNRMSDSADQGMKSQGHGMQRQTAPTTNDNNQD